LIEQGLKPLIESGKTHIFFWQLYLRYLLEKKELIRAEKVFFGLKKLGIVPNWEALRPALSIVASKPASEMTDFCESILPALIIDLKQFMNEKPLHVPIHEELRGGARNCGTILQWMLFHYPTKFPELFQTVATETLRSLPPYGGFYSLLIRGYMYTKQFDLIPGLYEQVMVSFFV
jgi:hypothetical protein